MSRTIDLLHKGKPARPASPAPAAHPVEDETPYIEVGGPNRIEGSAEVLACPLPPRPPFLQLVPPPVAPPAPPAKPEVPPVAICTWNSK